MTLENKGLKLVREYEAEKAVDKAVDKVANILSTSVGVAGGLATLLFLSDIGRYEFTPGGLGISVQPSWTPGYEINHDGVFEWQEVAYLGGYIGATVLGVWATGEVSRRVVRSLVGGLQRISGQEVKDEEFNANYGTLSDKLISKGTVPSGLRVDYQDALYLDLLTLQLSEGSTEGTKTVEKVSSQRRDLATRVIREQVAKLSDASLNAYLPFLARADFIDLARHYIDNAELERADIFIKKNIAAGQFCEGDRSSLQNQLAESYFSGGKLNDAERLWRIVKNRSKLSQLSAAYRGFGDNENAVRSFVEYSQ